jgi:hypothetical protein
MSTIGKRVPVLNQARGTEYEANMNAVRIEKRLDSHVLPELIPMIGKRVEIIVLEESAERQLDLRGPKAGSAKGKVIIAPDFDAPLEDFGEYTA